MLCVFFYLLFELLNVDVYEKGGVDCCYIRCYGLFVVLLICGNVCELGSL